MSTSNGKKKLNDRSGKLKIQTKLRGERPPGVVGRMKPRKLIDFLEKEQRERTLEEDEQSWGELERILREDPV